MKPDGIHRIDRLITWIKAHRKDLCSENGEVSPGRINEIEGLTSGQNYWSEILRKSPSKSFGATKARSVESALGMPYLHLEGSGWPFEEIDFERWERLTDRQKGRVGKAVKDEIEAIEFELKQVNHGRN